MRAQKVDELATLMHTLLYRYLQIDPALMIPDHSVPQA